MTLASSLLLALEPAPISGRAGVPLRSVTRPDQTNRNLFETDPPLVEGRYSAVVIHDSGTLAGTADGLPGGLGYHFVIGNGEGSPDGEIVVSRRWSEQLAGVFPVDADQDEGYADGAIGICLIGDTGRQALTDRQMQQLRWLVTQLQSRLRIPGNQVVPPAGRLFPHARFGRQLLTTRIR